MVSIEFTPQYCCNIQAAKVIKTIATNEPGIFFEKRFVFVIITMLKSPTAVLHQLMVLNDCPYVTHLLKKSEGISITAKPNKSFT